MSTPVQPPSTLTIVQELGSPLRRFSDDRIAASVNSVLATIPADKTGAVLAVADKHGARLAVAARLGDSWTMVGVLEKPWQGELRAEAAVRFAW